MVSIDKIESRYSVLEQKLTDYNNFDNVKPLVDLWKNIQEFYENNPGYVNDEEKHLCADLVELAHSKIPDLGVKFQQKGFLYGEYQKFQSNFQVEYSYLKDEGKSVNAEVEKNGTQNIKERKNIPGIRSIYRKLSREDIKSKNETLKEDFEGGRTKLIEAVIRQKIEEFKDITIDTFGNINNYKLGMHCAAQAESVIVDALTLDGPYNNSREVVLEQNPALEATATTIESAKQVVQDLRKLEEDVKIKLFDLYDNEIKAPKEQRVGNLSFLGNAEEFLKQLEKKRSKLEQAAKLTENPELMQEYQNLYDSVDKFKKKVKADADIQKLRILRKELDEKIKEFEGVMHGKVPERYQSEKEFMIKEVARFNKTAKKFADEDMSSIEEAIKNKDNAPNLKKELEEYIQNLDSYGEKLIKASQTSPETTLQNLPRLDQYDLKGLVGGIIKDKKIRKEIEMAAEYFGDVFIDYGDKAESGVERWYTRTLSKLDDVKNTFVENKDAKINEDGEEKDVLSKDEKDLIQKGIDMIRSLAIRTTAAYCKKVQATKSIANNKRTIKSAWSDIQNARKGIVNLENKVRGIVASFGEKEGENIEEENLPSHVRNVKNYVEDAGKKIEAAYSVIEGLLKCKNKVDKADAETATKIVEATAKLVKKSETCQGLIHDLPELAEQVQKYVQDVEVQKLGEPIKTETPNEKSLAEMLGVNEDHKRTKQKPPKNGEGRMLDFTQALSELQMSEAELQNLTAKGELRAFRSGGTMKFRKADIDYLKNERATEPTIQIPAEGSGREEIVFEDSDLEILPLDGDANAADVDLLDDEGDLPVDEAPAPEKDLDSTWEKLQEQQEEHESKTGLQKLEEDSASEQSLEEQILSEVKELATNPNPTPEEVIKLMDKYSDSFNIKKDQIAQYKKFFGIEE